MYTESKVLSIVSSIKAGQDQIAIKAQASEDAFNLKMWAKSESEALEEDGLQQITSTAANNAILDGLKMLDTDGSTITVPTSDNTKDADAAAKRKKQFLIAAWDAASTQAQEDVMARHAFHVLLHGVGYLRVLWVEDVVPEAMKGLVSEISISAGTFREAGIRKGPLYTEFGYWSTTMPITEVLQLWPDYIDEIDSLSENEAEEFEVDDCWWVDRESGKVWNAAIIGGEWVSEPQETDYPMVPIIEATGDFSDDDGDRTPNSLLSPSIETWKTLNRILTQSATQSMESAFPTTIIENEFGNTVDIGPLMPRQQVQVPHGTKITKAPVSPQLPVTVAMLDRTEKAMVSALFPSVVSGEAPPSMQAGYGVGLLMSAASGRIKVIRRHIEISLRSANYLILSLVEKFSTSKGVSLYGDSPHYNGAFVVTLTPEDISGDVRNTVKIPLGVSAIDTQLLTLGIRLFDSNVVSAETVRNDFLGGKVLPADEEARVQLGKALSSPEIQQAVYAKTIAYYFGENWMEELGVAEAQQQLGTAGNPNLGPAAGGPDPALAAGVVPPEGVAPPGAPGPIQPEAIGAGMLPTQLEGQLAEENLQGAGAPITPEELQLLVSQGQI